MGNWNIWGIVLVIGLFILLVGVILSQIQVTNPITLSTSSILQLIIGNIWDFLF